jgi:hypothetical protein
MGMLRYQVFLTYGVAFISAWYYGLSKKKEYDLPLAVDALVTFAPVLAILVLGSFLIARLIIGVLAYQDCPDAAQEIDRQVVEARSEMKRRKIIE